MHAGKPAHLFLLASCIMGARESQILSDIAEGLRAAADEPSKAESALRRVLDHWRILSKANADYPVHWSLDAIFATLYAEAVLSVEVRPADLTKCNTLVRKACSERWGVPEFPTLVEQIEQWARLRESEPKNRVILDGVIANMLPALAEKRETKKGPPQNEAGSEEKAERVTKLSVEAKAIAVLYEHPEWTDVRIAEEVGCARTTLYKYPKYVAAREFLREAGRKSMPRGRKNSETGTVEAWEE
jgi:NAD-dependent oxidoreductase involved in siderophore biosynthesis